jgi:hypothetical protein
MSAGPNELLSYGLTNFCVVGDPAIGPKILHLALIDGLPVIHGILTWE